VPVLTSNVSSMPEVAGNAALLVDPTNEAALADGMLALHRDAALRERLVAAGRVRREAYSWDRTAERLWAGIERMG
jgi:glycosyltransferase involved in cell wall biosynthesis